MKLNLLPLYVKQAPLRKRAAIVMVFFVVIVTIGMVFWQMSLTSQKNKLEEERQALDLEIEKIVKVSADADELLNKNKLTFVGNAVVDKVKEFNNRYADSYYQLARYIPSDVRVTSMRIIKNGTGLGEGKCELHFTCTVNDLRTLAKVFSSFYECEDVELTGLNTSTITGPGTRYPDAQWPNVNRIRGSEGELERLGLRKPRELVYFVYDIRCILKKPVPADLGTPDVMAALSGAMSTNSIQPAVTSVASGSTPAPTDGAASGAPSAVAAPPIAPSDSQGGR